PRCGLAPQTCQDDGVEPAGGAGLTGASAGESRQEARTHSLRDADGGGSADIRVLHERRYELSLLLHALSREPSSGGVRVRGDADPDARAGAQAKDDGW